MTRASAIVAFALCLPVIGGCGGGGSRRAQPGSVETSRAFLPLRVGNWWVYEYRAPTVQGSQLQPVPDHSTRTVVGTTVIEGKQWFEVEIREWRSEDGPDKPLTVTTVLLRETDDGVYYYWDLYKVPLKWLDKSAQVGQQWTPPVDVDITWTLQDTNAQVNTPAGTFSDCWHVLEKDVFGSGDDQVTELYERWYKQGVGMVLDRYWPTPERAWDEHALLDYHVK